MNRKRAIAIILAGGRGTRMKTQLPKPLNLVNDKEIISWIIDAFTENKVDVGVVINPKDKNYFQKYSNKITFIYQNEPKGTGHAVIKSKKIINDYDYTFVFMGDNPFVGNDIIKNMFDNHLRTNSDCTLLSSLFKQKKFPYARIIRENGLITKFVEEIDANENELKVNELFCSQYLFKTDILMQFLKFLKPHDIKNEIYFTDILNHMILKNKKINSLIVDDWKRLIGLNTKEEISWIESQKII